MANTLIINNTRAYDPTSPSFPSSSASSTWWKSSFVIIAHQSKTVGSFGVGIIIGEKAKLLIRAVVISVHAERGEEDRRKILPKRERKRGQGRESQAPHTGIFPCNSRYTRYRLRLRRATEAALRQLGAEIDPLSYRHATHYASAGRCTCDFCDARSASRATNRMYARDALFCAPPPEDTLPRS